MNNSAQQWRSPPHRLRLEASGIHVWKGIFRPDPVQAKIFSASLSDEEKARAGKLLKPSDRERFVFAHGMLRSILGYYVGYSPKQITFKNNAFGKPALADPADREDIRFNLAHSGDVVLVAMSRRHEVGVDVEFMRPMSDVKQLISRNFSLQEKRYLDTLPADQLERAFFVHWTLKEAFIKGIGLGLSYPLEDFSIAPVRPGRGGEELYTVIPKTGPRWQCLFLSLCEGYVGALAAESIGQQPSFWNYHSNT
jgi:4'-phosphopantetheinyl transferase